MIKAKFKNLSLKKKMLCIYLLSFVFPLLVLCVVIYVEISRSMLKNVRYSSMRSYEQANDYLEYRVQQIIRLSDVVVMNQEIKNYLNSLGKDIYSQIELREEIGRAIREIEGNVQDLAIRIYISDRLPWAVDGDNIWLLAEADEAEWYRHKREDKVYFSPDLYLEEVSAGKKIALVRDIVSDDNYRKRIGVVRIDIELKEIRTTLQNAAITPHAVTYLVNSENRIVASSDLEQMEKLGLSGQLDDEFAYDKYWNSSKLYKDRLGNQTVYYMRDKIRNTDWEMITVIPELDMLGDVFRVQGIVILVMLVFFLLTLVGGTFIISWVVRRIAYLVDSMKLVQSGNLQIHLENDCEDEIGILYDNYNRMIERTSDLMEEQYQMGQRLKSAELKALQSQINPHFLYNTLDTINWLAHAGRTDEISSAVVAISKYYRLILNRGEDMLSLRKELSHVGYYIRIQNMRYPGKFDYRQEVSEEVLDSIVPKIILQPLVENAILHGILEKKNEKGTIRIGGILEEGQTVCLTVEDDGIGIDTETMRHILDGSIRSKGSSYGVRNVNARIRMMFGEEYGLFFESEPGKGTRITIRFPMREE